MSFLDELEKEAKTVAEKAIEFGEHEIAQQLGKLASIVHRLIQGAKGTPEVPAVPEVPPVDLNPA